MFSGIIEEKVKIIAIKEGASGALTVKSALDHTSTRVGDSIAINGVCLTVREIKGDNFSFDLSSETMRRTTFSTLRVGSFVNLERALKIGDRLHGHFVYGHIDAVIELLKRSRIGSCECFEFQLPEKYRNFIVEKGSVALSGVSLTVAEVSSQAFSIYVIPHTLKQTTLDDLHIGDKVNLEVDMLARYVVERKSVGVTEEMLQEYGFLER